MLEFQLTPNSISAIHFWLTGLLAVSFLLTATYLVQLVKVGITISPKSDRICKLMLAVLASLQTLAWQLYCYQDSHDTVALWCFATAVLSGGLVWQFANGLPLINANFASKLPWAIMLLSFAEFAGFAQATRHFSDVSRTAGPTISDPDLANPGVLVEKTSLFASTDCGTPIPLFERKVSNKEFREYITKTREMVRATSERAMLRAEPFLEANCHGWVFSQGEHIVKGETVQLILDENKYTSVDAPQPNDVVIYRSAQGEIIHTGIVRGTLEGSTIVESKWGIGGLYLHVAEEQPYSQYISYYRTERPTHRILISTHQDRPETATASIHKNAELQASM